MSKLLSSPFRVFIPTCSRCGRSTSLYMGLVFVILFLNPSYFGSSIDQSAWGACLLSLENAQPLKQGNVKTGGSFFGGHQGMGGGLIGRIGLLKESELHIRMGSCQRTSLSAINNQTSEGKKLWGFAFEMGLKKELLPYESTQWFTLSIAMSTVLFQSEADEIRVPSYSSVGFQPLLLMSFPFQFKGFDAHVNLSGGMTLYFVDQNLKESQFEPLPVVGLNTGIHFTPSWALEFEGRFQENGLYGGLGFTFAF